MRSFGSGTITKSLTNRPDHSAGQTTESSRESHVDAFSRLLTDELLFLVNRPGQYLGNEWGAQKKDFGQAEARLCLAFPDLYELGMSNFGLRILYQLVNSRPHLMADRTYALASDMEELVRARQLPLWGWESRQPITAFELLGFSLAYELTYTNVLNILDMSGIPLLQSERTSIFPLVFGGGPASVNPEPMALFMDFFIIGDGESAVPAVMDAVAAFKRQNADLLAELDAAAARMGDGSLDESTREKRQNLRNELLMRLATEVPGVYVPSLYEVVPDQPQPVPRFEGLPARVLRQVEPLNNENQPTQGIVPYLATVHDRQVLEVRRGCDRGCRFCQPGYTFLPVRERSTKDLLDLSKQALDQSGYQEYSLLSLCVSDYTTLHESVRALNREHTSRRASMSFPSQRADRMNFDVADELKAVRKSGITLAPEAGTERLRAVINKGLRHEQIINAITAAYASGWPGVKLYFMMGLPTEEDADLQGIIDILKEATEKCRQIRRENPATAPKKDLEVTCTLSNFVPKPFTPFQWFAQVKPAEIARRQAYLRECLKESRLRNAQINFTHPEISLLESVISRGDRHLVGRMILDAYRAGAVFDAWDERFQAKVWHQMAQQQGTTLEALSCEDREVGSRQPWDVVHIGLMDWWLVNEWKKAIAEKETGNCTENTCHACGVCTELDTTHALAKPNPEVMKKNPFVKELNVTVVTDEDDSHPSLFVSEPPPPPPTQAAIRLRFEFQKVAELKFIGHLDLLHLFQRAARRARINLAYTEGFNPSPKLNLALSLSLYCEGLAEVGEVDLCDPLAAEEFVERMNRQLPPEIQIMRARPVERKSGSLEGAVSKAVYRASIQTPSAPAAEVSADELRKKVSELLTHDCIEVAVAAGKGKKSSSGKKPRATDADGSEKPAVRDIRPGIFAIQVIDEETTNETDPTTLPPPVVELVIAHGPRMHVKPTDILKLLCESADWRLARVALLTEDGSQLFEERVEPSSTIEK